MTLLSLSPHRKRASLCAVVLLVTLAAGLWSWRPRSTEHQRARAALLEVATRARPVEARLAGFPWAPVEIPLRSGGSSLAALVAADNFRHLETGEIAPDPVTLSAAHLIGRDTAAAIEVLQDALERGPDDPHLLANMSAAYLQRAEETGGAEDAARSLEYAERGLKANPRSPEVSFNRALALSKLPLHDQAATAWMHYLALDYGTGWSEEARAHASRLSAGRNILSVRQRQVTSALAAGSEPGLVEVARLSPQRLREAFEDELLGEWATMVLASDKEAALRTLTTVRVVGKILSRSGDGLPAATANALDSEGTTALRTLAEGHGNYAEARRYQRQSRLEEAQVLFEKARIAFEAHDSPFIGWVDLQLAIIDYQGGRFEQAAARLAGVTRRADRGSYLALRARAEWIHGLIHVAQARFTPAVDAYEASLRNFERLNETENVAAVHNLLTEVLRDLGRWRESWSHARSSLAALQEVAAPRRQTILLTAATTAAGQNLWATALVLQEEALKAALESGVPNLVAESHLRRAISHRQLGNAAAALDDVRAGESWRDKLPEGAIRQRLDADIAAQTGELRRISSPESALPPLTTAIDYFTAQNRLRRLPALYLARARAHLAIRQVTAAESDLTAGIQAFESFRVGVASTSHRISYFDEAWQLFETLTWLHVAESQRPDAAFDVSERARNRTLIDRIGPNKPSGVSPARRLEGQSLLYFDVLEDALLAWVHTGTRRHFFQRKLPRAELERLVGAARRELNQAGMTRSAAAASRRLYDELILPALPFVLPDDVLVIVADGPLHALSFAALVDSRTDQYLIEQRAVALTPSASIFLTPREDRTRPAKPPTALVFGNPDFESSSHAMLRRLPGAAIEAQAVARLYPGSAPHLGKDATADRFLGDADRFDVVHFAGHAIANDAHPELSEFLFSRHGKHQAAVTAEEIAALTFQRTQLVVLAACSTAVGAASRGEGAQSLARPFLAGGVPSVVATLWDVEDTATLGLVTRFHDAWIATRDPARALRRAQLSVLAGNNEEEKRVWAAFAVLVRGQ